MRASKESPALMIPILTCRKFLNIRYLIITPTCRRVLVPPRKEKKNSQALSAVNQRTKLSDSLASMLSPYLEPTQDTTTLVPLKRKMCS